MTDPHTLAFGLQIAPTGARCTVPGFAQWTCTGKGQWRSDEGRQLSAVQLSEEIKRGRV